MAVRGVALTEELQRRVDERIGGLPVTHMTAMQAMATFMWRPMAVMGVMILFSGAIIAGVNSFRVDEFFGFNVPGLRDQLGLGAADLGDLRDFRSVQTWLPGYQFMGMGLMFAAIIMVVASILGRLRILGGTVQASLDARIEFPPFPLAARVFPVLMMVGLIVFLTQLGLSAWLATEASAGDFLTVDRHADWLQGMRFAGVGIMLTAIALALFTITTLMSFMATRIRDIAAEALEAEE